MKKVSLFLFLIFCGVKPVFSADNLAELNQLYAEANQYYADELYFDAIENYTQLLEAGAVSKEIYYNLGNAYYRLGKTGKAILNYHRALRIDPADRDVKHNLKLAQLKVPDKITAIEPNFLVAAWESFFKLADPNRWGVLSLILMWVAVLLIFSSLFLMKRFSYKLFAIVFAILFFISSVTAVFSATAHWTYRYETSYAIMIETNAYVKSEPNLRSDDLFMIREGTKMTILRTENEFSFIELADGKSGWLHHEFFEVI